MELKKITINYLYLHCFVLNLSRIISTRETRKNKENKENKIGFFYNINMLQQILRRKDRANLLLRGDVQVSPMLILRDSESLLGIPIKILFVVSVLSCARSHSVRHRVQDLYVQLFQLKNKQFLNGHSKSCLDRFDERVSFLFFSFRQFFTRKIIHQRNFETRDSPFVLC